MPARRKPATARDAGTVDGRQLRSERSRAAIVQALFDLIGSGVVQPTAQQVAEAAGVGIRSVFRHFADMESLFAELDARLRVEAEPILADAPTQDGVAARARALAERRIDLFERIAPYKRAGDLQRSRSQFLRARHSRLVRELRTDLLRWLPELRDAQGDLVEAIDLALSFEAWNRLRSDQRLGRDRARDALLRTVAALAAQIRS